MEEFSEFSSEIVEFPSTSDSNKSTKLTSMCIGTDPLEPLQDSGMQTNLKQSVETQTTYQTVSLQSTDDKKLATWLRKIYPAVEAELKAGLTPIPDEDFSNDNYEDFTCRPYQKLSIPSSENSQGYAIWLSVHTNNAPALVVTTSSVHENWCNHIDRSLKIFIPKRTSANFVLFTEHKTVPVKACIKCLSTNPFNKDMFAGGTVAGDLYVWKYGTQNQKADAEIMEIACESVEEAPIALDWLSENQLITASESGNVIIWKIGSGIFKERIFTINERKRLNTKLTTVLALSRSDIVAGTENGNIFLCSNLGIGTNQNAPLITELKSHTFAVISLLKVWKSNSFSVLSSDLSGELYVHSLRNLEDEPSVIMQIPLPFKNAIGCAKSGEILYCPGNDGTLDIYRVKNGAHTSIKGSLQGRANFVKCNDQGTWIVSGLYGEHFQIYKIDFETL